MVLNFFGRIKRRSFPEVIKGPFQSEILFFKVVTKNSNCQSLKGQISRGVLEGLDAEAKRSYLRVKNKWDFLWDETCILVLLVPEAVS